MRDQEGVVAELAAEHRSLGEVLAQIQTLPADDPRRRTWLKHTAVILASHAVTVEQVLRPAVRRHTPGDDRWARQCLQELARAEEVMKDLEFTDTESGEFDPLLRRLIGWLRRHVDCEESMLLPHLGRAAPPAALEEMTESLRAVEADAAALLGSVEHARRPDVLDRVHTALTERHPAPAGRERQPRS